MLVKLRLADNNRHADHQGNHQAADRGENGGNGRGENNPAGETADSGVTGPDANEKGSSEDGNQNSLLIAGHGVLRHFLAFRRIGLFRCIDYIQGFMSEATLSRKTFENSVE